MQIDKIEIHTEAQLDAYLERPLSWFLGQVSAPSDPDQAGHVAIQLDRGGKSIAVAVICNTKAAVESSLRAIDTRIRIATGDI